MRSWKGQKEVFWLIGLHSLLVLFLRPLWKRTHLHMHMLTPLRNITQNNNPEFYSAKGELLNEERKDIRIFLGI